MDITLSLGLSSNVNNDSTNEKPRRANKGKSLLVFPSDYVVIDIETTGLSPEYDSIIELCAQKYVNRQLDCVYSTLINPGFPIDDFITSLTGITNEMLSTAPKIESVISDYADFIGDNILVGHNVNFDINFLYDVFEKYLSKPLKNDFIDTLRLVRRLHKDWKQNSLQNISERYNLNYNHGHRANFDCELTNSILEKFRKEFIEQYGSNADPATIFAPRSYNHNLRASEIIASNTNFDIDNPLYEKCVVITGSLDKMTRREAMQLIADSGGINGDSVTKKTDYLILGNNDYCKSIKTGKSTKHKKAEQLKLDGQSIEIIPENVFYDMLNLSQFQSSKTSTASLHPIDSPIMTTDIFAQDEIDIFRHIKKLLSDSGQDISILRCHYDSGKILHISNFYNFIGFKICGKKRYFIFPKSVDISLYDLTAYTYENGRYLINDDFNISSLDNILLDIASASYNSFKSYESNIAAAKKHLKDYLRDNYHI